MEASLPSHRTLCRSALAAVLTASLLWTGPVSADATAPGPSAADRRADGTNLLVVGVDRRSGMSPEDIRRLHVGGHGCNCTDVMMLVHIAADRRRLSVISIPRDSYVPFAPHDHPAHHGKINAAYRHGGPDLAVRTVEQATGVRVDHYLEADFVGFADAVDRLGGAQVCTATPLWDPNADLRLAPGTHTVDGAKALRYVRARYLLPPGDLGRVRRQQRLLLGMLARLTDARTFDDPVATSAAVRALLRSVHTDERTSAATLFGLARSLRRLTPKGMEFATVPISNFDYLVPKWGASLLWDAPRAERLFAAVREDRSIWEDRTGRPLPVDMEPATVSVRVDDPRVAGELRGNGFDVRGDSRSDGRSAGPTVITYDPEQERYVGTLATALPGARLKPVPGHGLVFDVAVGSRPQPVKRIEYDRSMVEGAPETGDRLRCR